jgi:hypothetical protein
MVCSHCHTFWNWIINITKGLQEYKNTNKSKTELGMQGDPAKQIRVRTWYAKGIHEQKLGMQGDSPIFNQKQG